MTDKCTSPEGHRWMLATRNGISCAACLVDPCDAELGHREIEALLNSHASLTEKVERLEEYAKEGWTWVDEFCALAKTDVFGLRALLGSDE